MQPSRWVVAVLLSSFVLACSDDESSSPGKSGSGGDASVGGTSGSGGTLADASTDAVGGASGSGGSAGSGGTAGTAGSAGAAGTAGAGGTSGAGGSAGAAGADAGSGCVLPPLGSSSTPGNAAIYFRAKLSTAPADGAKLHRAEVSGSSVGASAEVSTPFWLTSVVPAADGKRLALAGIPTPGNAAEELYVMDSQPGTTHAHCLVPRPVTVPTERLITNWSPNGNWLAFRTAAAPYYDGPMYVARLSPFVQTFQLVASVDYAAYDTQWSSDSRFVAYSSAFSLYVTDLNASPPTAQLVSSSASNATFIPSSHTLVYSGSNTLVAHNLDTGTSAVFSPPTLTSAYGPVFSDDGTRIAFFGKNGALSPERLFVVGVVNGMPSGTPTSVIPDFTYDTVYTTGFVPGSHRLLAQTQKYGLVDEYGIYLVDATSLPAPLAQTVIQGTTTASPGFPAWSPDAKSTAYAFGNPGTLADVYFSDLSQATPGTPTKIGTTSTTTNPGTPVFSSTGDQIAVADGQKVLVANKANFAAGFAAVSPAPASSSLTPQPQVVSFTTSGVLLFTGALHFDSANELFAWNGTGLANPVHAPFVDQQQNVYEVVVVPQ